MTVGKPSPWFLVIMAVTGMCLFVRFQPREVWERMILGQNDFMQLYAGARLMGSSAMYSRAANEQIQREVAGVRSESMLRHSRPPFYAVFLRPLAWLPYRTAYYAFQATSVFCFLVFLWMFVPGCRALAAFASLALPLFACLESGQDATLLVMLAGISIHLARRNLEFWAGFVLSLCAIKFHLFALVPLIVVLQRRWRILYGGLAGGALLMALSFIGGGADWPRAYLQAILDADMHPNPRYMPNIHIVSALLSGAADVGVEVTLSVAVILAVGYLAMRLADYELVFAFALIGSMLVSFHSYMQDCVLLLLPLAIILTRPFSKRVRELTELSMSPIPYLFLYVGMPYSLALLAAFIAVLGTAVFTAARSVGPESPESRYGRPG